MIVCWIQAEREMARKSTSSFALVLLFIVTVKSIDEVIPRLIFLNNDGSEDVGDHYVRQKDGERLGIEFYPNVNGNITRVIIYKGGPKICELDRTNEQAKDKTYCGENRVTLESNNLGHFVLTFQVLKRTNTSFYQFRTIGRAFAAEGTVTLAVVPAADIDELCDHTNAKHHKNITPWIIVAVSVLIMGVAIGVSVYFCKRYKRIATERGQKAKDQKPSRNTESKSDQIQAPIDAMQNQSPPKDQTPTMTPADIPAGFVSSGKQKWEEIISKDSKSSKSTVSRNGLAETGASPQTNNRQQKARGDDPVKIKLSFGDDENESSTAAADASLGQDVAATAGTTADNDYDDAQRQDVPDPETSEKMPLLHTPTSDVEDADRVADAGGSNSDNERTCIDLPDSVKVEDLK